MRIAAMILAAALSAGPALASEASSWRVATVHDGDTFEVIVPDLPAPLQRVGIRVRGVDAPEIGAGARCAAERHLADHARDFTVHFLSTGPMQLEDLRWDKYGGRVDARVLVNGEDLAPALIAAGLGHPFNGEGKRAG